jgi:hypothetical protein
MNADLQPANTEIYDTHLLSDGCGVQEPEGRAVAHQFGQKAASVVFRQFLVRNGKLLVRNCKLQHDCSCRAIIALTEIHSFSVSF